MREEIELKIDDVIEDNFTDNVLEQKILKYILTVDWLIVWSLDEECFTSEPSKKIFNLVKENEIIFNKKLLSSELKKVIDLEESEVYNKIVERIYKDDLEQINEKNIGKLISKLKKLRDSRKVIMDMYSIIENIDEFDLDKVKEKMILDLLQFDGQFMSESGDYLQDFELRKEYILKLKNNPEGELGFPTGVEEIDENMGNLRRGEVGLIMASTGVGKSIVLMNFGVESWLAGFNVLIVSLEMTKEKCMFRIDSRLTEVLHTKFRKGELEEEEMGKWEKTIDELRKNRKNTLEVLCLPKSCNAFDIEREMKKIQVIRGCIFDLVIIDYWNLMSPIKGIKGASQKNWENQGEISWDVKMFAKSMKVGVWTANQVTTDGMKETSDNDDKSVTKNNLKLHHLKYSKTIAENCDWIFGVIVYSENLEEKMEIISLKTRDSEKMSNSIILTPNYKIMRMNYKEFEEKEEEKTVKKKKKEKDIHDIF